MKTRRAIPFSVNRNDARSLVDQVADGLRQAIVTGHWRVGEEIPSTRELVPLLGVSHIVTRAALSRLAAEGYVLARHGLKPVVRDQGAKQWKGHVVFVYADMNVGYFQTGFAEALRKKLNRAGYLFTRATADSGDDSGKPDFSLLDVALSRSVDLVIALTNNHDILQYLARRNVPFAVVSHRETKPSGAVGITRFGPFDALGSFATACRESGIGKATVMHWESGSHEAARQLRKAGMSVSTVIAHPDFSLGRLTAIEHAGFEEFSRRIKAKRLCRDTAWFFADDYLARGALMAMIAAGVRAPEDIRVATLANAGNVPLYVRDLSRVEMDSSASGAAVADAAIEYLATGKYPEGTVIGPKWIQGETLSHSLTLTFQGERT